MLDTKRHIRDATCMITRGPIADYRSWPFGGSATWGWRDIVYAVPIIVIVAGGLALMPLIERKEHETRKRREH